MIIQHNMSADFSNYYVKNIRDRFAVDIQRLSSGYRINSAADDAAGLTISEKLRWQIRGLNRASQNIQDGISLIQTGEGALQEVHEMLHRMKELAIQAANDTNTNDDRDALQSEINQIKSEINRISTDTTYNTIRLFKPNTIPEITGSPTDILVYHEDYNGTVREGGIIYNGKRYAYEDMDLKYDSNGNIVKGTYSVGVEGESGNDITIKLMFDGGDRVPSGREYELSPGDNGISIDGILHEWSDIKDTNGNSLNINDIKAGVYSFEHAGATISFEVGSGLDKDLLIDELMKDTLETYSLESSDVTTVSQRITPWVTISDVSDVRPIQNYIPGTDTGNSGVYKMHADADGIYMYIPSTYSHGQGDVELTRMTWEDLGLDEYKRGESINPSSNVSEGEKSTQYTYTDSITGISINFNVDSEVSKNELISAINNWDIDVTTNNSMNMTFNSQGNVGLRVNSVSNALKAYGTQYDMGRTMSTQMVLATNEDIAYDSATDVLSYEMTDANGQTYTFKTASGITSGIASRIKSDLNSYINSYAYNWKRYLDGATSTRSYPSASYSDTLQFTCDSNSLYSMTIGFDEDFSGWINDSMFTTTQNSTTGLWTVSFKGFDTALNTNIDSLASEVVSALDNNTVTIATDSSITNANNSIVSTTTTQNKRYSSVSISGDREVMIQAGALGGQGISIKLRPMNTAILEIGSVDVSSYEAASASINKIDGAVEYISDMRSEFGATQNRLEKAMNVDDITAENSQAAESRIRDADMAEESMNYALHNILLQSAQSMLAQAVKDPEGILMLLQ